MDKLQTIKITCPECFGSDFWETKDHRFKCKKCRYLFKYRSNIFNISDQILNEIITEFLLDHSTNIILERVNVSKYKLLKTLTFLRTLMVQDIPDIFKKIIKTENYLNKEPRELKNYIGHSMRHISSRPLVIGIICQEGWVFAKTLPDIEINDLKLFLKSLKEKKSIDYSENWQKNMGLVFKNYLYRLSQSESERRRIDAMDAFWGYLKRKLTAKGGIRKEKISLYLGEYVWKYNHRKLTIKEQEKLLSNLILQYFNS